MRDFVFLSMFRYRERLALQVKERSTRVSDLTKVSFAAPFGTKYGAQNLVDSSDSDSDVEKYSARYLPRTRRCSGDSD